MHVCDCASACLCVRLNVLAHIPGRNLGNGCRHVFVHCACFVVGGGAFLQVYDFRAMVFIFGAVGAVKGVLGGAM